MVSAVYLPSGKENIFNSNFSCVIYDYRSILEQFHLLPPTPLCLSLNQIDC